MNLAQMRRVFGGRRSILRKIVSAYIDLLPGQLRFTYNEYGKPSVSGVQNDRCPYFATVSSAMSKPLGPTPR
jgi:phosphopantetheinyl transferase